MICPVCEQGSIFKAKVIKLNIYIFICYECDAIWRDYQAIVFQDHANFSWFMEQYSLPGLWNELSIEKEIGEQRGHS